MPVGLTSRANPMFYSNYERTWQERWLVLEEDDGLARHGQGDRFVVLRADRGQIGVRQTRHGFVE